jgi:hypothetical protein
VRRMRWARYLWPGWIQLSTGGSWSALVAAVGAAVVLNLALLSSFVWIDLLGQTWRSVLWGMVGGVWSLSALYSLATGDGRPRRATAEGETFADAVQHYLRGNWFEAERILVDLLHADDSDVDARLMLATLLRRRQRWDEAAAQLDELELREQAVKWHWEVRRERTLLAEALQTADTRSNEQQTAEATQVDVPTKRAA